MVASTTGTALGSSTHTSSRIGGTLKSQILIILLNFKVMRKLVGLPQFLLPLNHCYRQSYDLNLFSYLCTAGASSGTATTAIVVSKGSISSFLVFWKLEVGSKSSSSTETSVLKNISQRSFGCQNGSWSGKHIMGANITLLSFS